ncbi:hypothetical protein C6P45_002213 [Maudiozyma exigua]|uniref:Protein ECM9 n=1 Tax=Maudiozyma exigua TaxID=34358 RepID=A0A9P6VZ99_MAUEX|nr:hypothetical protein C6P45_002213 [Kazachstania exigua]
MNKLQLKCCKELYNSLTDWRGFSNFKLEFASDQLGFEGQLFFRNEDPDNNTVELICFKSSLLTLFSEGHSYLNEIILREKEFTNSWDVYYMTLGFMLSTPENKMILAMHEDCLLILISESADTRQILEKELLLVQALLTSTRNSINKSSSMWYLYRKIYLLMEQNNVESVQISLKYLISTFRNSAGLHVSNYYCWNTLRWFFDVIPSQQIKQAIFEMTKSFCLRHISDCSSWDALGYICCQSKEKYSNNIENYYFLRRRYSTCQLNCDESYRSLTILPLFKIEILPLVDEIVHFIDSFFIKDWTVYLCLLRIVITYKLYDAHFLQLWKGGIMSFENTYKQIKFKNGTPLVPNTEKDNLSVSNSFLHYGWKKIFLNRLEKKTNT